MLSKFHNPEDNNYHTWLKMALLSKQVGYSLSVFSLTVFGQILKTVTKCYREQNFVQIYHCRLKKLQVPVLAGKGKQKPDFPSVTCSLQI